jgi:hypothetical protein
MRSNRLRDGPAEGLEGCPATCLLAGRNGAGEPWQHEIRPGLTLPGRALWGIKPPDVEQA